MVRSVFICVVLVLAVAAVYWRVGQFEFVYLDDPANVIENRLVTSGLAPSSLRHALTTSHPDYWRPVTWFSFMIDYELHGLSAGGYHITNVILHIVATLLVYAAFVTMTASPWPSAFVAAVFALHPLHVESVAWVTERKDV